MWIWAHRFSCLKLAGLALLIVYFLTNPFYVEPTWIAAYLAVVVGVGAAFVLAIDPVIDRFFPKSKVNLDPIGGQIISEARRRPLRVALLLPGEDGFFFVPLLWVGITPITAAIATAAFAALHYPQFPLRTCAVKFIFLFCIAIVVLPHGLGSVVVGHLLLDAMAIFIGGKLFVNTPAAGPRDA